jgi:hypothetical protein
LSLIPEQAVVLDPPDLKSAVPEPLEGAPAAMAGLESKHSGLPDPASWSATEPRELVPLLSRYLKVAAKDGKMVRAVRLLLAVEPPSPIQPLMMGVAWMEKPMVAELRILTEFPVLLLAAARMASATVAE